MKFKHLLLASATGLLFSNGAAFGQAVGKYGCYTDEHNKELEIQYPGSQAQRQAIERQIQQYINQNAGNLKQAATLLKIPVVVHVVTEKGLSGMSKAQVLNGIDVLNKDFRKLNPDVSQVRPIFQPHTSDLEIEFAMARKDPQGNPTEGIVRVTSLTTNGPVTRDHVKAAAPAWPTDKYFNIWLVRTINSSTLGGGGTILGYAQFPGTGSWNNYGLVMLDTQWGRQGEVPGSTANSNGRTATHEVGHCFNLYHTFQGSCGSDCSSSGDLVCDTPPAQQATYGCNLNHNTCPNDATGNSPYTTDVPDQLENYMSYDDCQMMFTNGQKTRTRAIFDPASGIPQLLNLVSASNATFTAIDPSVVVGPLRPKAYFGLAGDRVCVGGTVTFTNETYDGAATSYLWTFPGGTPGTSTAANPTITYNTPGKYDVTLVATNAAGSTTYSVTNQITVTETANSPKAMPQQQYTESFEDPAFPNNAVASRSLELKTFSAVGATTTFERTQVVATDGTSSLRLRNGSIPSGTITTLITPNIDVTGNTGTMFFTFDLAYAQKTTTASEEMRVFLSNDCGATWTQRYYKFGANLATNGGAVVSSFTPTASQWRRESMTITPNFVTAGKIMFKFEVTTNGGPGANGGNTLYLDNLRMYTLLGENEALADNNIKVYPNPITNETGISFNLKTPEQVSVKVFDLVGNTVYKKDATTFGAGSHNLPLYSNLKNLQAGMYMVQVKFGDKVYNTKLISQ